MNSSVDTLVNKDQLRLTQTTLAASEGIGVGNNSLKTESQSNIINNSLPRGKLPPVGIFNNDKGLLFNFY